MSGMIRMTLLGLGISCLSGCIPAVEEQRGHMVLEKDLAEIHVGQSDFQEVFRVLGSPSSRSAFGPEIWYYIGTETEKTAFLEPEIKAQQILAVHFDDIGRVTKVERYNEKDGRQLSFAEEETPTEGQDIGVAEQLLGNLGRFNKAKEREF